MSISKFEIRRGTKKGDNLLAIVFDGPIWIPSYQDIRLISWILKNIENMNKTIAEINGMILNKQTFLLDFFH